MSPLALNAGQVRSWNHSVMTFGRLERGRQCCPGSAAGARGLNVLTPRPTRLFHDLGAAALFCGAPART